MTTTLLAIDDSKTMRRVLEITFAGENYRTVLAESSDDALAKLRAERPQVALIDHSIAGQSGYELCQQIKREAPTVGVIILSSKQIPYDKARGASVGADDFIDKPFDTQQLIDKVGALVRRAAEAPRAAPAPAAAPAQPVAQAAGAGRPRTETLTFGGGGAGAAPSAQSPTRPSIVSGQRTPTMVTGTAPAQAAPSPAAPAVAAAPVGRQSPARAPEPAPIAPTPVTGVRMPAKAPAAAAIPAAAALATAGDGQLAAKLSGLGLSQDQVQAVLSLSRDVVEKVVWEVVPVLAETLIREEIKRLTSD